MLRAEERIGRSLEEYFADRYQVLTQPQIAAELAAKGIQVSDATISRWMRELDIEARLPGQRPPEGAPA